jgi:predicted outer membrane repeat protein
MTSNIARRHGADHAIDTQDGGGAIYATDASTVIASVITTHCTMTSNGAEKGGAVYASGKSTAIATYFTIASGQAAWGGGVYVVGDSVVIATDCTMGLNTAQKATPPS